MEIFNTISTLVGSIGISNRLLYFSLEIYQRDNEKLYRNDERKYKNADPDLRTTGSERR